MMRQSTKSIFLLLLSALSQNCFGWNLLSRTNQAVMFRGGSSSHVQLQAPLSSITPASRLFATPEVISEDKATEWTKKRFHNTPLFRSIALLAVLVAAGASAQSPLSKLPAKASSVIHVISFGTWFGTVMYTTFVAGITMFKNLPRQTFGKLQAKLFPKYFALGSAALVLQVSLFYAFEDLVA